MRKKEPPSPAVAAQMAGPPLSHAAYAEALERKRDTLEREVAAFRAHKEEEYNDYRRRLSLSVIELTDLKLQREEKSEDDESTADGTHGSSHDTQPTGSSTLDTAEQTDPNHPSPLTPQHDKESELRGLFLPHFIPLLDHPPQRRGRSPPTRVHSAEIPAQRSGVCSSDPSTFSPRTSPSPSQISHSSAIFSVAPKTTVSEQLNACQQSALTHRPPYTDPADSDPISPTAIPSYLRPSTSHRPSHLRTSSDPSATLTSPTLLSPTLSRPGLGTRTSSTQSEGFSRSTSLRSSLKKSSSLTRTQPKKKHVRISIGNMVMAPSESPSQTRSAFRPPSSTADSHSQLPSDELGLELDLDDDRGRLDSRDVRAGKARIDDEGGARRRHKKRISSSKSPTASVREEEPLDYFPPQPLRGPSLPPSSSVGKPNGAPRYAGMELIQPTTTAPTTPDSWRSDDKEEFDIDDPMFGADDGAYTPKPDKSQSRKPSPYDEDVEDMFREDEEGREIQDVVNGHDLVEDDDQDDFEAAMPSPSPHASSMPIGIKGPGGWKLGRSS